MTNEIRVAVYVDHSTEGEANPWSYNIQTGLPRSTGRIGASWDNLNHVEAIELFMIEMDLDLTHNYEVAMGGEGDDLFAVIIKPKKYTTDFDIAFSVSHDAEPDDITTEMVIEALEQRIEEIKENAIHDFEMGDTFENN